MLLYPTMTMNIQLIQSIIRDFHVEPLPVFFERSSFKNKEKQAIPLDSQKIITLIGPRRSGRTAQLFTIMQSLLEKGTPKHTIIYINFEDERYNYETMDLDNIIQAYLIKC